MTCETAFAPTRRALLGSAGTFFAWSLMPRSAHAVGAPDNRLIVIILRGAMDGLSAVAPIGDPDYLRLREDIAIAKDDPVSPFLLDDMFALYPAMPTLARLYQKKQALYFLII